MADRFMTTAEAAKRLGYTIQHARRLILAGKLNGMKLGRDWLVLASSVEILIAHGEHLSLPLDSK